MIAVVPNPEPMPAKPLSNAVRNELIKLRANALNTAATSCFSIGLATPIAGYLYDLGGLQASLSFRVMILGGLGWLTAAICLHLIAGQILKRLLP